MEHIERQLADCSGQQADSNLRGEVVVDVNSKSQITVAKVSVFRFEILCFFLLTPET